MKKTWKKLGLALLLCISSFSSISLGKTALKAGAGLTLGLAGDPINGNATIQSYYEGINGNLSGTALLGQLQELNGSKRTKTVGYKNMGTYYAKTDGDPNNSGNLICFYSGVSEPFSGSFGGSSINREHVWPDSRGGNQVEGDIHMPRPTLVRENGSRSNSFYVEGATGGSYGWDPAMESFGKEIYRGISARIIFYCVVASRGLSLVDKTTDSTDNHTMGKLSDLLKWNLQYPVDATETRRNDAAQVIQGNRNPFIDDRSLACKIWGDYNENTRNVCATYTSNPEPASLTINSKTTTIGEGGTLSLSVTANPLGASNDVTWSSSNTAVATVNKKSGLVTAEGGGSAVITATSTLNTAISASITITVKTISEITLSGTPNKTQYVVGDQFIPTGLIATAHYNDGSTGPLPIEEFYWLDGVNGTFELALGTTSVMGSYGTHYVTYEGITVSEELITEGYQIVFGDNGSDATNDISTAPENVKGYLSSGSEYVDSFSDMLKVFKAKEGIKLSSSSFNGKMTVKLSSLGQTKATSIVINAKNYYSDSAKLAVNGQSFSLAGDWTNYTVNLDGSEKLQTIVIEATKRCYIKSISVNTPMDVPPTPVTLTGLSCKGSLQKTTYEEGETFDPTGLSVTAHYDNQTTKDVTAYVIWEPEVMTLGTTSIIGKYSEGSIEKTVTVDGITVNTSTSTGVTSVSFEQKEVSLKVGMTYDTKVTVLPETAENKAVTYLSDHPEIVSVDEQGKLTAIKEGTATIEVKSQDNAEAKDTMTVNVQAEAIVGTKVYRKVTEAPTDWSGEYLIVDKSLTYAMKGSLDKLDAVNNYTSVTDDNSTIASDATIDASTFTIAKMDGGYSIQSKSGNYIGKSSNSNGLDSGANALLNTLSLGSDGDVLIQSAGGAYLRFNKASNQMRFRYYASSKYKNQQPIYLYKLIEIEGPDGPHNSSELQVLISDVTKANTCTDYIYAGEYRSKYNDLAQNEKDIFDGTVIEDAGGTVTLKDKLAFMEKLYNQNNPSNVSLSPFERINQKEEQILMLFIILFAVSSFSIYCYVCKKRARKA